MGLSERALSYPLVFREPPGGRAVGGGLFGRGRRVLGGRRPAHRSLRVRPALAGRPRRRRRRRADFLVARVRRSRKCGEQCDGRRRSRRRRL